MIHLNSRTVREEGLRTLGVIERAVTHAAPRRSNGQLPTVKQVSRTVPVLGRFIHDLQQHEKTDTEKRLYIYNSHLCARKDWLRNANAVTSKAPLIKCFGLKRRFFLPLSPKLFKINKAWSQEILLQCSTTTAWKEPCKLGFTDSNGGIII